MKSKNIIILSVFLSFFIFIGGVLFYNTNGLSKIGNIQGTINKNNNANLLVHNGSFDLEIPELNMDEKDILKIRLKKEFINFIKMIYKDEFDIAYEKLNKEYVETYSVYEEEFKTLFNEIEKYKHFKIVEDFILEDRCIIRVFFFDESNNNFNYIDKTFTVFIQNENITYADRGILSFESGNILIKDEDFEVSISNIIRDTEGLFYEMYFLNKTDKQVEIEDIYGIKNGNDIRHKIFKGNFLSYELKSMFYKKNLVFFRELDKLNSIKIKLSNEKNINIEL